MMDSAFFVGRSEIISWINSTLQVQIGRIEDTAFGGIACQFMDIIYPGQVAMSKVNWMAKTEPEYVTNYKVLQNCMTKNNVEKFVDVDRLVKGRYQDNLEFMQWLKRFYELKVHELPVDYDVQAVRVKGKGGDKYNTIMNKGGLGTKASGRIVPKPRGATTTTAPTPKTATTSTTKKATTTTKSSTATTMKENRVMSSRANTVTTTKPSSPGLKKKIMPSSSTSSNSAAVMAEINALKSSNEEANKTLSELRLEMDGLEKERDFYFEKLRDVEILLQDLEDKGESTPLCAQILKILYATADGFEQVEDETALPVTSTTDDVSTMPPVPAPVTYEEEEEKDVEVFQPVIVSEDPSPSTVFSMPIVEQESY